jgi:hypothetical protein
LKSSFEANKLKEEFFEKDVKTDDSKLKHFSESFPNIPKNDSKDELFE